MIGHLNADISFCELGGRLFFLDIRRDRYFQLSGALERSFLDYLITPDDASIDTSELVRHHLGTRAPTTEIWPPDEPAIPLPDQSVLETPRADRPASASIICDVFVTVYLIRWQLKKHRLKSILQGLQAYRHAHTLPLASSETAVQQRLMEAATDFNRVRPYVPVETCCLIDSLSMVRFLAKRGLHSYLVMGITCDPFSAHAWVQHGALVLNEAVGTVQAHAPIRVI